MRTTRERLIDVVFLEIIEKCNAFQPKDWEQAVKFIDEIVDHLRKREVVCEANLYKWKHDLYINDWENETDLKRLRFYMRNLPFSLTDYLKWEK